MVRGAGLWEICFIGAYVIDRVLLDEKLSAKDILKILNSSKRKWSWSTDQEAFKALSGRDGVLQLTKKIVKSFPDPNR
jgi:hypothetical protein